MTIHVGHVAVDSVFICDYS